jgi:hypothetical protein
MPSADTLFTVASPANVGMGTLARMAQAAYLLGYVLRLVRTANSNSSSLREEISQLDRTIWSLINLSYTEGQIRRMAVCSQTSLCYRLVNPHSETRNLDKTSDSQAHSSCYMIPRPPGPIQNMSNRLSRFYSP